MCWETPEEIVEEDENTDVAGTIVVSIVTTWYQGLVGEASGDVSHLV